MGYIRGLVERHLSLKWRESICLGGLTERTCYASRVIECLCGLESQDDLALRDGKDIGEVSVRGAPSKSERKELLRGSHIYLTGVQSGDDVYQLD